MRLLRLITARLLLQAGNALFKAGAGILDGVKAERLGLAPRRHPAEVMLLGSMVGMAICALWIAMTWRAAI